jgi:hypothetical protein
MVTSMELTATCDIASCSLVEIDRHYGTVPWLRSLLAGLSPRRPGFAPESIHVGFVVDKVALGQVFLRVL